MGHIEIGIETRMFYHWIERCLEYALWWWRGRNMDDHPELLRLYRIRIQREQLLHRVIRDVDGSFCAEV